MPVAIGLADAAILVVNDEFCALVSADFTASLHRFSFGRRVFSSAIGASAFHVPTTLSRWDDVHRFPHEFSVIFASRFTRFPANASETTLLQPLFRLEVAQKTAIPCGYSKCVIARRFTKSTGATEYALQNVSNSITSTLRSPDSHFDTKDWGRLIFAAACACVIPALARASRSRRKNASYPGENSDFLGVGFGIAAESRILKQVIPKRDIAIWS